MNLEQLADQETAITVKCPDPPRGCKQPVGQRCRNLHTGLELVGQPAHAARLLDAGVVHPPVDRRELDAPGETTPRRWRHAR